LIAKETLPFRGWCKELPLQSGLCAGTKSFRSTLCHASTVLFQVFAADTSILTQLSKTSYALTSTRFEDASNL
jgi:hypothetical protein